MISLASGKCLNQLEIRWRKREENQKKAEKLISYEKKLKSFTDKHWKEGILEQHLKFSGQLYLIFNNFNNYFLFTFWPPEMTNLKSALYNNTANYRMMATFDKRVVCTSEVTIFLLKEYSYCHNGYIYKIQLDKSFRTNSWGQFIICTRSDISDFSFYLCLLSNT